MDKQKTFIDINVSEKSDRIIELENNPEFHKLSYNQQIILLTGEKLLQIDRKLRDQASNVNNFINGYSGAINNIVENQKNINQVIKDIIRKEILDISNKIQIGEGIAAVDESKIISLIEDKYNDEICNMESRFHDLANQTVKNLDDSIFDTLEKVDSLKQFEIKAREEIQKNQDRIYVLEQEIARQKEINDELKNNSLALEHQKSQNNSEYQINNYQYYDSRFNTIDELESFIKNEAKKIAKVEVEKYVHDYNLFSEDRNDDLIDKLFEEGQIKESEISKMYKLQMDNSTKMNELEHLLDEQNRQIRMLSEDRQRLVSTLSETFKDKELDVSKILESIPLIDNENHSIFTNNGFQNINPSSILNKDEMEIVVKKQAIELIKEKINFLNKQKVLKEVESINEIDLIDNSNDEKLKAYFDETNKKIKILEEQLQYQIKENDNLKNDLFDEISKNGFVGDDEIFNGAVTQKNDKMIDKIEMLNFDEMTEEELMKQHNYYNGNTLIPGTKITRINNYKINNDVNSSDFSDDARDFIKKDVEKTFTNVQQIENTPYVEPQENEWQTSNQKIIDLESLINRQEEEIKRLRENKPTIVETTKVVENIHQNDTLNSIDESIKSALNKLQDLAFAQENTKREIEETNKKIFDLESQLKRNSKNNSYEDELARIELDKILEEKYKLNAKVQENNYSDEIKKIELERKKIEETLELERIRLLSEIEANRKRLNDVLVEEPKPVVEQPTPIANPNPQFINQTKEDTTNKKEEVTYLLESPKKKRKQQVFFEVKIHSTPKLTRADLEK